MMIQPLLPQRFAWPTRLQCELDDSLEQLPTKLISDAPTSITSLRNSSPFELPEVVEGGLWLLSNVAAFPASCLLQKALSIFLSWLLCLAFSSNSLSAVKSITMGSFLLDLGIFGEDVGVDVVVVFWDGENWKSDDGNKGKGGRGAVLTTGGPHGRAASTPLNISTNNQNWKGYYHIYTMNISTNNQNWAHIIQLPNKGAI
ncbi:hypothetical protein PIB30_046814 [Stylosanthes scabra]|uniref:Uncharacterized protein n=1 Tax=Stylosanthes scabra TaxID=79078 RepID=A0ABU6SI29_9FABA|nr:hypothetical protein [Stylosanthes scabra]